MGASTVGKSQLNGLEMLFIHCNITNKSGNYTGWISTMQPTKATIMQSFLYWRRWLSISVPDYYLITDYN